MNAFLESCDPIPPDGTSVGWLALRPPTLLPSPDAPELVIFQTADCRWLISDREGVRPLDESTELRILGRRWRWCRYGPRPMLAFQVSQDEEHVRLLLECGDATLDFGERTHHQTLLLLARERRSDERQGVSPPECGWRDVYALERMLGIDLMNINTHVSRARRQVEPHLARLDPAFPLVERRPGQARFGPTPFTVNGAGPDSKDAGNRLEPAAIDRTRCNAAALPSPPHSPTPRRFT